MNPTNSNLVKQRGCNPVASGCVVWTGPDLPCIDLCKGDTINEVIFKLATELCNLIQMFDLSEFDLSCFNLNQNTTPSNIRELIQLLINRVCTANGLNPDSSEVSECPENCIVQIAECFYFQNQIGDTVTTMSILDYVTAIGNRICDILSNIQVIEGQIATLQQIVNGNQQQIEAIPNLYPRREEFQYQVSVETDGEGDTYFVSEALRLIENNLNATRNALGTTSQMFQSILAADNITNEDRMFGIGLMNSYNNWVNSPQNLSHSINNIWLSIHDLRQAVEYLNNNAIARTCSDIILNFRATLNVSMQGTYVTLFTDNSIGFNTEWIEVNSNSIIKIEDTDGNSTSANVQLLSLLNNPNGNTIDIGSTSIDPTLDLKVTAYTQFKNTVSNITCIKEYVYEIIASPVCPNVTITAYQNYVNYTFSTTPNYNYIINIYLGNNNNPVVTQMINNPGVLVNQSLFNLIPDTGYELEVVLVDTLQNQTACNRIPFTTLINTCNPPTNVSVNLTI
jgi:hypothetical protein